MEQRLGWWQIGVGSVLAGAVPMIGWEFLLENAVLDWLGIGDRAESLREKLIYIVMGTIVTALIVAGTLVLVRLRVAAEKELGQSEERFRLVFQESPGLFAMTRAGDGLHYDVNEQWLKVLGYSREEVIGRTAAEIGVWADPDDRRRLMEAVTKAPSLRNFEARLKTKDGRILPVLAAVEKVVMGGEERFLIVSQEITEIKKVENALRASERQLRAIFDNMQDIYYRTDRDGRVVMISSAADQLLGYSREEVIGKRLADFYWDPRDRDRLLQALAESGGRMAGVESRLRHRDGRPLWVWTKLQYWHDDAGDVGGVEGISRDITERKKTELALAQFKMALDQTLDCVFMFEPDSLRFVYVNQGAQEQVGYGEAEMLRMTPVDIKPEYDEKRFRALLDLLRNENKTARRFETVHRHKDGHDIPVEIFLQLVSLPDDQSRYVAIVRDITERKRMEETLRSSERQLRGILDNMQDIYYRTDREGRFIKVSPAIKEMLGYAPEEVLGRRVAEFYWNPENEKEFRETMKKNGGRIREHEMKFRRRDGRPIWLWTNGQYLYDASGAVVGIEGTSRDITDRKDAEEELRKAHDELEIRVQERTRELKEALEQVSEVSRAKSDFLANMSHELRTPMNAILGFSDMLAKETLGPMGNPRYRDYAVDIYESGQHLLALINELLDLARIEARTLELRDDVVDVGTLVRAAIHMCEGYARKTDVTVQIAAAASLPRLRGDELRLTQVFVNLIGNALKFTPAAGRVDVRYGVAGNGGIEAVIADTGPGIAPEDIERVQTLFARGRQPFVRTKEGLGLGLPLAKAFMAAHGGTLDIASSPGKGTVITLGFPPDRVIRR